MLDPDEGTAADGTIVTGVARSHVPSEFEPVLQAVVEQVDAGSLYLYGSVATGRARPGLSDLDLLSVGFEGEAVAGEMSRRFAKLVRGVEISGLSAGDLIGERDEAYGNRVFLRHYCVHLAGPDLAEAWPSFPADARAARGFNGDIAAHLAAWRRSEIDGLARRMARKTMLALAGLVCVHDGTWTTDLVTAARRWGELRPDLAEGLNTLLSWSETGQGPPAGEVRRMMDEVVSPIVADFRSVVGLWH